MQNRKPCKECPWIRKDGHSLKFRGYVEKMEERGYEAHACHMQTKDIWGIQYPIDSKNECAGRKLCSKKS